MMHGQQNVKFQFVSKQLYFGPVYQSSTIYDIQEIIIKINAKQRLESKIYPVFTQREATFAHLSVFMFVNIYDWFLVNDQRDAQILFYIFISIYNSLHVSNTSCLSSGETNCINAASGNSHSMLVAEMRAGWKKTDLVGLVSCVGGRVVCSLGVYSQTTHDTTTNTGNQ